MNKATKPSNLFTSTYYSVICVSCLLSSINRVTYSRVMFISIIGFDLH